MKKNQVNAILTERTKRRNMILAYSGLAAVLLVLVIAFGMMFINKSRSYTVKYKEDSNIDYKVYLKDNPFFKENYLASENEYLESLIDYVDADFKYQAQLNQKEVDFKYSYKIDANVEVKTKEGKNPIYKFSENLLGNQEEYIDSKDTIDINQKIKIDYNHYNDLIKDFVKAYGLDNIDATLKISMHVNVLGTCDEFEKDSTNDSVMSLVIPLTTKTVDINISDDLIESEENEIVCNESSASAIIYLVTSGALVIILIVTLVRLIKYIIDTRTAEDIYHIELGKILNNYGTYIQQVEGSLDLSKYESWRIKTFEDMMEISDRVNQPILMLEDDKKSEVYFLIPNEDKRIYYYGLKVSEIKKQMKENEEKKN